MASLLDLFNIPSLGYRDVAGAPTPDRFHGIPAPAVKKEWNIRSGEPEPGLEQVTPEEWLPPGLGTKLAALLGKGALLAGAIKSSAKSALSHDPAERAAAFLTAQRNAAKPVSEGGLGLRPDNTAQERASAMGFNGEGYHYSQAEDEIGALDPLNHPLGMKAAINENGNVPSDFIGTHVGTKDAALDRFSALNEYYDNDIVTGATYPVLFKNDSPYRPGGFPMTDYQFSQIPESLYGMRNGAIPSKAKVLKMRDDLFANNSNVPYRNDYEHVGSLSNVVPPQNIRSRFAAFDPSKRGSSDLLGHADPFLLGMIAGGTGGGIALNKLLQLQALNNGQ